MPMTRDTLCRCLETPHSDVLNQDTISRTEVMAQDIGDMALRERRAMCCSSQRQ